MIEKRMICEKCLVGGRVQGVWFRASTQQVAEKLGLVGYARNLADGRVEVLACGSRQGLDQLKDWLWQGPQLAQVESVTCQLQSMDSDHSGFTTG